MPVARKVIDAAKPILEGTKFGKIIGKSDDILSYGEDIKNKYGGMVGATRNEIMNKKVPGLDRLKIYNANKLMKPEFEDEEDDDFE